MRCRVRSIGLCKAITGYRAVSELDASHAPVRVLRAGEVIYHQGDVADRAYNVVSGWVGMQSGTPDGRRGLLHLALPGDVFGLEPLAEGLGHAAWAVTTAVVCAIGNDRLRQLREEYPALNERFIWMIERQGRLHGDVLEALLMSPANARAAFVLWSLAVRSLRRRPAAGEEVMIPLNQVVLAGAVGITPVHLNRTLHELQEKKVLSFAGSRMKVWDPEAIQRLCAWGEDLIGLWLGRGPTVEDARRLDADRADARAQLC
jgi:CRP-like cAMP-binding protein